MSCTCCSERQSIARCSQLPSARHLPTSQANGQIASSGDRTHIPPSLHINSCVPAGGRGYHYHHSQSNRNLRCGVVYPSHTHHHTHMPMVTSPLVHAHHQVPTTQSRMAIVHPHHHHRVEPSPLNQPKPHKTQERSPLGLVNDGQPTPFPVSLTSSHKQLSLQQMSVTSPAVEPSLANGISFTQTPLSKPKPNPRLEPSPVSRPHPPRQHRPSGSSRPHPHHREPLFPSEKTQFGNKLVLPALEFSPVSREDLSRPTNTNFQLGVATKSYSTPMKKPISEAAQVQDETINYGITTKVVLPPVAGPDLMEPVVPLSVPPTNKLKVKETRMKEPVVGVAHPAPPVTSPQPDPPPSSLTVEQAGKGGKHPIPLYRWSFKVMAREMVVLMGYKSEDSNELKWRSGPIEERLSASLVMTKSGQLYQLMGRLNLEDMKKEAPQLSKKVLKKFKKGFPSQWIETLREAKHPTKKEKPHKKSPTSPPVSEFKEEPSDTPLNECRVKEEVEDDRTQMMTPVTTAPASTPHSNFLNSLKRSSRGRTIKPTQSSIHLQSCSDLYSYDWRGNFMGVTSFIDLTLSDNPLPPSKRRRRVKKEPAGYVKSEPKSSSFCSGASSSLPTMNGTADTFSLNTTAPPTFNSTTSAPSFKLQLLKSAKVVVTKATLSPYPALSRRCHDAETGTGERTTGGQHGEKVKHSRERPSGKGQAEKPSEVEYFDGGWGSARKPHPTTGRKGRGSADHEVSDTEAMLDVSHTTNSLSSNKKGKNYQVQTLEAGNGFEILGDQEWRSNKASEEVDPCHLRQVVLSVPAVTSNFWEVVAKRLATGHTAQQCFAAYHKLTSNAWPSKSKKEGEEKAVRKRRNDEKLERSKDSTTAPQPRRSKGRVKTLTRDTTTCTSEESESEYVHKKSTKPHPPSTRKEKHRKLSENTSMLDDLSRSVSASSLSERERKEKSRLSLYEREMVGGSEETRGELTDRDLTNLNQIVHKVPALTTNFWEVVAKRLATGHTAQQCSTAYHEQASKMKPPSTKLKKTKKESRPAEVSITAKTGTLKRKRQLRNALEHLDNDYFDDIFDSTPLKKIKKSVKIPESHDNYFEEEESNGSLAMHTPSVAHARVGAPASQTPNLCDYLTTPDLKCGLKRDVADHVIYNAQKAQRAGKKGVHLKKPSVDKSVVCEKRLHNIRTGELTTLRMFEDSDDSTDDESDPFHDILTF